MQQFIVKQNEAGQRLDKFLHKYLQEAGTSFLYKMLRKKNITLNKKKAEGKEILQEGDSLEFFFSEETFAKFRGISVDTAGSRKHSQTLVKTKEYETAFKALQGIEIVYEDAQVLFLNKPAGILSQKAEPTDLSLNEWLIGYLLHSHAFTEQELETFKPSVCNRLDRNTSGIVLCGKTLAGSQKMSALLKERTVHKFYRTFVKGNVTAGNHALGYLQKNTKTNRVRLLKTLPEEQDGKDFARIETKYYPVSHHDGMTYLEVELITGKTHQIRAHLASLDHPILGDPKYGDLQWNREFRKENIHFQLLHAYRLEFPELEEPFSALSGKTFLAEEPEVYHRLKYGKIKQ